MKNKNHPESASGMHYVAIQKNRMFNINQQYSQIDWGNLLAIIDAFRLRFDEWYFRPIATLRDASSHYAFAAMALNCLLIDALSQFAYGLTESKRDKFIQFVREHLPKEYASSDFKAIIHLDGKNNNGRPIWNVAEAMYHSFRCGIIHQAHPTPYGLIDPEGNRVSIHSSGHLKYQRNDSDCPSIVINPWDLHKDIAVAFGDYIEQLKDSSPRNTTLRTNFKKKFSESFGVCISKSTLP